MKNININRALVGVGVLPPESSRDGLYFHSFVVCHSLFTGRLIDSLIQHEEMKDIFSQKTELKN